MMDSTDSNLPIVNKDLPFILWRLFFAPFIAGAGLGLGYVLEDIKSLSMDWLQTFVYGALSISSYFL